MKKEQKRELMANVDTTKKRSSLTGKKSDGTGLPNVDHSDKKISNDAERN